MTKRLRPERRAEIRRLIEAIRADLREIRALLEARMEAQGR